MYSVRLASEIDFDGWRKAARAHCAADIPATEINWVVEGQSVDLFEDVGAQLPRHARAKEVRVPKRFISLARKVVHHTASSRFAVLYKVLRKLQAQPGLLEQANDPDINTLLIWEKNINRDVHKMHAFVRFRKVSEDENGREYFAAWFEPEHRCEPLGVPFFQRRFPNMDWMIVTPHLTCIWDGKRLQYRPGGKKSDVPDQDTTEEEWKVYFRSIFNPARVKISAMTSEMPKKYWKNLPEAELIPSMLADAETRIGKMQAEAISAPNIRTEKFAHLKEAGETRRPQNIEELNKNISACEQCELY